MGRLARRVEAVGEGFEVASWLGQRRRYPMSSSSRSQRYFFKVALSTIVFGASVSAFGATNNPIPQVVGPPVPQAVAPGTGAFTLTVYGAGFVSGATVNWNGTARSTTFISNRELQAQILASDVAKPTAGFITVTNPAPGRGKSSSSYGLVEVHTPTKTIVPRKPHVYPLNGFVWSMVAADFNRDGKLDLMAGAENELYLLLGQGDGTFQDTIVSQDYFTTAGMAYGDFNDNGKLDLAFAEGPSDNQPPSRVEILLGKGNGDFKIGPVFGNFGYTLMVAGDFNGDGHLDLIVIFSNTIIEVFLGNGHGGFHRQAKYVLSGSVGTTVVADFNHDGNLDLAIDDGKNISVLFGHGDGTFQAPVTITPVFAGCAFGPALLVNDFNSDGNSDLAFCDGNNNIGVLLGHGDGTFSPPTMYATWTGGSTIEFAAGDFNSDGKTDVVVSHPSPSAFAVFLGKGDGTFRKKKIVKLPQSGNGEGGIVPGDFNSDGLLDFALQSGGGGVAVYTQK